MSTWRIISVFNISGGFHCFHSGHLMQLINCMPILTVHPIVFVIFIVVFVLLAPQLKYSQVLIFFFNAVVIKLIKISIDIKKEKNGNGCEWFCTFAFEELLLCILVVLCFLFLLNGKTTGNKSAFPKAGSCSLYNS